MIAPKPFFHTSVLFVVIGLFALVSESTFRSGQLGNNDQGVQPVCSDMFGVPNELDCRDAISKFPSRSPDGYLLEEYETVSFWGPRSMRHRHQNRLPMYFKSGNCVVGLFLKPWGYCDASWRSIRLATEDIVSTCRHSGGYTLVGSSSSSYITLVVFETRGKIPDSDDWALLAIREYESEEEAIGHRRSAPVWIPAGRSSFEQSYYDGSNSCDYGYYCRGPQSCGGGCNCVLQKEFIDPLTFGARRRRKLIGVCGAIKALSSTGGLGRRSLGEEDAGIQCLCNATLAHRDCCLEEKPVQTFLES